MRFSCAQYGEYSEKTRKSLARLNETVIDYDLVEELLTHIHETQGPGAVLVFMPGIREARRRRPWLPHAGADAACAQVNTVVGRLAAMRRFREGSCVLLPLHSALPASDQRRVFQRLAHGVRKIVVATNIAETSLTIPDVVFVVDAGRQKCRQYNARTSMSSLEVRRRNVSRARRFSDSAANAQEEWVSLANARQRQGRAGRVQAGHYYALFTQHRASTLRCVPWALVSIVFG